MKSTSQAPITYPNDVNTDYLNSKIISNSVIKIHSQLYNFISHLSKEVMDNIEYPIIIKDADGIYNVVRNDQQLKSFVIETANSKNKYK